MALGKGLSSLIPKNTGSNKYGSYPKDDKGSIRVWQIPLTEISPNPHQPRKNFSHADLEDLVLSIKKHGVLQPITVTEKIDGGYELIAGERRLRASQIAGLTSIPSIVKSATEQEKLELALIENIQRQDLNPIEEAFAYERLISEFGLTQQQVAEEVGKSRPVVANTMRLLDLPEEIKKALVDKELSVGKAIALLSLKDEKEQLEMYKSFVGKTMTVRDLENVVAKRGEASRKGSIRRDPNLLAKEQDLEEKLGTKVRITQKGDRGVITIEYNSKEELKRLIEEISQ